ncbi:hypothetical protein [Limosilactobacillus ingluviei]|uniref:Uncharacterized protein n=1 Tax=Limosilactobacillus ingluviei DSM 15946 TaxID=1423760 RepID=A0A0R1U3K0_9LACO|nr:hypothetical protein [Limosilactobacillus ingluviei]KRL87871.1 hypothetical protein FC43_GL000771 [Limosilactobacillus ingluviei DSM 15946]
MSQPFFDQTHQEVQAEANWLAWPDADLETTPAAPHALVHHPASTPPATVAKARRHWWQRKRSA